MIFDPNLLISIAGVVATLLAAYWQVRTMIGLAKPSSAGTKYIMKKRMRVSYVISYAVSGIVIIAANLALTSIASSQLSLTRQTVVLAASLAVTTVIGILGILFTILLSGLGRIFDHLFQSFGNTIDIQHRLVSAILKKETEGTAIDKR
jgi:hypothetical protein